MARRPAALLALVVAAAGSLATNLAYAPLEGEWTDGVTLGPDRTAALRRLTVTISAEALPATEGLLSGGTYGPISVAFPEVAGLEVAIIDGSTERPTFVPAGEHVLLDSGSCEFEQVCRRAIDLVVRLAAPTGPTDVEWTISAGVYVPGGQLPDGAELTVSGLDAPPTPVAIHELDVDLDGAAAAHSDRPVDLSVTYVPARGTQAQLHHLSLDIEHGGAASTTSEPPALTVNLARASGAEGGEEIVLAPNESAVRELQPLATCLASCRVAYRMVLTPAGEATDAQLTANWRVRGWLFALADPDADPPTFDVAGGQAEPEAVSEAEGG